MAYFSYDDRMYQQEMMQRNTMTTSHGAPVPYYMAFPMDSGLLRAEEENYQDLDYMKQLYPKKMRRIQEEVEKECDKLEYEGSMMFDEYPDQLMLRNLCNRIYDAVRDLESEEVSQTQLLGPGPVRPGRPGWGPPPPPPPGNQGGWLQDMIQVLLFNEMYNRRCRYRNQRCRRWRNPL